MKNVHDLLCSAIQNKCLISFKYKDERESRIAEPHDYGVIGGAAKLLVYQLEGASKSGDIPCWKMLSVDDMYSLRILRKSFPGGRGTASGKHKKWDHLFARVAPVV